MELNEARPFSCDLLLLPDHFSGAGERLVEHLDRAESSLGLDYEGAGGPRFEELQGLEAGAERIWRARGRLAGKRLELQVEIWAAPPGPRIVPLLRLHLPEAPAPSDLDLAVLRLATVALAGEEQGALLAGQDFPPAGVGLSPGRLCEQVVEMERLLGRRVDLMVLTAATAAAHAPLEGFQRRELAGLYEDRRI